MCRYAIQGPYKNIYACFKCRKSFKQRPDEDLPTENIINRQYICPQCRQPLENMGHDFKAPRQKEIRQWKKVERLFNSGIDYHSCGCGGPGYRPARLKEVDEFLEEKLHKTDGEKILKRIKVSRE